MDEPMKSTQEIREQLERVESLCENDNDEVYQATLNGQAIALKWALDGGDSNGDIRKLIEEWRERGVEEPYGMTWHKPADELEELIDDE